MVPLQSRSNDADPSNPRGAELNRFSIAFTVTAGLFVAFRIGIRASRKLLGWDDLWIGIAFIFSILLMVSVLMIVRYGFGMHSQQLTEDRIEKALFWWYLNQVFYKSITWPTKISILLMYRRVFLVVDDIKAYGVPFRTLIWATLAIVVSCYISFEAAGIFQCTPVQRSWNDSVPGHCTAPLKCMYAYAGCNFVTDVIILLLPMPLISSMTHVTKRQKIGLMGIFALGGFVCVTIIIRMSNLHMKSDIVYSAQSATLWTTIEANVGIICACLPLMRSVIIYLLPWFADRTSSGRRSRGHTGNGSFPDTNGTQNSQRSSDRKYVSRDQDDPLAMSSIMVEDARSLKSSEVVIQDKIQRNVNVETGADSSTEDEVEYDIRNPT